MSGCICAPLGVELHSFTAKCTPSKSQQTNNSITISWSTGSEANNDYFTVERSTSASGSGSTQWEEIGIVDGAGSSTATLNYEFIDVSTPLSTGAQIYYRLRQTDFDSKFKHFDAVAVESCNDFAVFPNPAVNELGIRFFSETEDEIILDVYDVMGKLVIHSEVSGIAKGNNLLKLDISSIGSGMYMLNIKSLQRSLPTAGQTSSLHKKFTKSN